MRELLFRGKSLDDDEFVYGNLVQYSNGKKFIHSNGAVSHSIEVDPITIGQFTGITDKNGHKIFEFDIVQDINWAYRKGIVKFGTGTFDSGIYEYNGWYIEDEYGDVDHNPLLKYTRDSVFKNVYYGFEICGNIFDNKDLLNGDKQ